MGGGQQPGAHRRRDEDLHPFPEARQPVHGGQFMLEGQRQNPAAVRIRRQRRLQRRSDGLAEDLGETPPARRGEARRVTRSRGLLAANSADQRAQNPARSKPAGRRHGFG